MHMIASRGTILVVLTLISLALAASLAAAPANRPAQRRLAALLVVLAGVSASYVIGLARLDVDHPWLRYLPLSVPLAIGPLLYGYVQRLTRADGGPRAWLHLVPAFIQFAYLIAFFFLPLRWQAVLDDGRGKDAVRALLEAGVLVSLVAYSLAGLRLLRRYSAWLVQTRSDADLYAGRWIRNLLAFLLITLAGQAALRVWALAVGRLDVFDVYGFYLWLAAIGVYLGVEGRRFADRRFPQMGGDLPAEPSTAEPLADAPAPRPRDWRALGEKWRDRTQAAGWWRQPNLTLSDLARLLATNTSQLSRAINEGLGQNFAEMINGMRASEVAHVLDEGADGDLLDIAFEAGFSSKASFNRAFRAAYGVPPSAWRKRLK